MILDVTRHKFFEGLATLLLFALVTAIATGASYLHATFEVSTSTPLSIAIANFAIHHPMLAVLAIAPLMVYSALRLSRATARASLYPEGTLAAISLAGVTLMALLPSAHYATTAVVALLTCETFGRLLYCFGPNIRAHYLFTSMLALGTLPLVDGALLPLTAIVVILTMLLRGTLREAIIAIVGVSLPLMIYCYVEWLTMGDIATPIVVIRQGLTSTSLETIIEYLTLPRLIFIGVLLATTLASAMLYFANRVTLGIGARKVWFLLLTSLATLAASIIIGGWVTPGVIVAMAIIAIPMLPMLFICVQPLTSVVTYILFIIAGVVALM